MAQKAPKGLRLHIGIYGRRNVGKSSFLNAVTRQDVSIVSDVAGTTTDPVEKAMELLPLGPVLFIDTAGVDDVGSLGKMRTDKTRQVIKRTDVAVLVTTPGDWTSFEDEILRTFNADNVPVIVVFNKTDMGEPDPEIVATLEGGGVPFVKSVATERVGVSEFREALLKVVPEEFISQTTIVADLIPPGELVMLVVPIDLEAPKGRLILPQVQTIRDLLDHDSYCMVVKERELRDALDRLKRPPKLVVTDSQAFLKVAGDTPDDILMTSFSILFARFKGDLDTFVKGAMAIDDLKPGDRVLVMEACTHHPIGEDIGRIKIPRWLTQYVGGELKFEHAQGHDFPEDLSPYSLIVHCGSCVFNRRNLLSRLETCRKAGVPITNYGVAIAFSLGIFERALKPFPSAYEYIQKHF